MRLQHFGFFYKVRGVIRYFWARIYYSSRFESNRISLIGARNIFFIAKGAKIKCLGRIILNDQVMLFSKGVLILGDKLGVNAYSRIVAHHSITIGSNVTIGQMVSILDHDHDYDFEDGKMILRGYRTAPIIIGDQVWVGDKCTILKGVTIGNNVIIGANSLVNKDVPSYVMIAGNPAKIIKRLDH